MASAGSAAFDDSDRGGGSLRGVRGRVVDAGLEALVYPARRRGQVSSPEVVQSEEHRHRDVRLEVAKLVVELVRSRQHGLRTIGVDEVDDGRQGSGDGCVEESVVELVGQRLDLAVRNGKGLEVAAETEPGDGTEVCMGPDSRIGFVGPHLDDPAVGGERGLGIPVHRARRSPPPRPP